MHPSIYFPMAVEVAVEVARMEATFNRAFCGSPLHPILNPLQQMYKL